MERKKGGTKNHTRTHKYRDHYLNLLTDTFQGFFFVCMYTVYFTNLELCRSNISES